MASGRLSPAELRAGFWARVRKLPGFNACWLWIGYCLPNGYGQLKIGRRNVYAHRYSVQLARGAPPTGLVVRHSCDTPACVRPSHLLVGTQLQNVADMHARGRARPPRLLGERNGRAKLADAERAQIVLEASLGASRADLARRYGVSVSRVNKIARGGR